MAANPFDQFDKPAANPFDKFDPGYKAPERGMLRGLADLGVEAVSGVARGVKFTADAFGANNAVSRAAVSVDDFAREYLSAQAKEDDKRIGEIMAAAQDAGIWEQVKAAAEAFMQAPGRMAVNALGTSVPTIAATMIPGVGQAGAAARLGMLGGMGAVQGAGTVKGAIYEAVKAEQMKQPGMTEDMADELATRAQEYGGENTGNIAVGAALGAAASSTGAQPVIAKLLQPKGMLAEAATEGVERGILARTGMGVVKETPLEAAQGGQEQLAANMALQNEGFDVPTFRGVAGNAALEGLAAGPMGAVAGALDRPVPKTIDETPPKPAADPLAPDAIASVLAAPSLDDAIAAAAAATGPAVDRTRAQTSPLAAEIRALEDPQDRQEALGLVATAQNPNAPGPVRRFAQNRLDELLLSSRQPAVGEATELTPDLVNADVALRQFRTPAQISAEGAAEIKAAAGLLQSQRDAAAVAQPLPVGEATDIRPEEIEPIGNIPVGEAVEIGGPRPAGMPERRRTDGSPIDPTGPNAVAAYIDRMRATNTPAARAFVQDFAAGRITRDDVMGLLGANPAKAEPTADERLAAAAGQKQQILPTDLLTGDGMPYGSKTAAGIRAKKEEGTVVPVEGGWVVRKETASVQPDVPVPADVAVPAADAAGDQPGGGVPAVRPVADAGPAGDVQAGVPEAAGRSEADQPAAGRGSELDQALNVEPVANPGDGPMNFDGNGRWTFDRGAMPGEPYAFLDGDADTAPAAMSEVQVPGRGSFWRVSDSDGVTLSEASSQEEAARLAEKRLDERAAPEAAAPTPAPSSEPAAFNEGRTWGAGKTDDEIKDEIEATRRVASKATTESTIARGDEKTKLLAEFEAAGDRIRGLYAAMDDNEAGGGKKSKPSLPEKVKAKKKGAAAAATPEPAAEPPAAPEPAAEATQEPATAAPPAPAVRNEVVIELRKRLSVLNALRTCLG